MFRYSAFILCVLVNNESYTVHTFGMYRCIKYACIRNDSVSLEWSVDGDGCLLYTFIHCYNNFDFISLNMRKNCFVPWSIELQIIHDFKFDTGVLSVPSDIHKWSWENYYYYLIMDWKKKNGHQFHSINFVWEKTFRNYFWKFNERC